ncbi:hypothetical protein D6D24_09604 [Aureobasidium pullulans]|uniref:F-box domain-containing protein n=1 Tax=Aureobasidium pullulans TaxID=5580 RepID=A0A4S8VA46_AURPU|nr:hypothetical protein D6D24_09604 [Aureobasidium pullulans]
MSSTNPLTGPSASTVAMSARQEFTPEQLERIKSVVDCLVTSSGLERTPGSAVADLLHTQDLMSCRTGPITPVKHSPPISFLNLPAEVRNKIYRHCLVVGSVFPRRKAGDSRTESFKQHEMPQTKLFLVCRQIFHESAPMYFGLNKFVISYGPASEWPWFDPLKLRKSPVSRFAYDNIKSMSIPFHLMDNYMTIPELFEYRYTDNVVERRLASSWEGRCGKMASLELDLLEVSFEGCNCFRSGRRLITRALEHLLDGDMSVPEKTVLRGFLSTNEVDETRTHIEDNYENEPEDKDPEDPWQIVIY